MKKRIVCLISVVFLCITNVFSVYADTISDVKNQKKTNESKLNQIQNNIEDIENNKSAVAEEVTELDQQLVELISTVDILKHDITNKEQEIQEAEVRYQEAVAEEQRQYEAMKIRIRYMYEKGDPTYLELFLQSKSMSDLINKADYVDKLYEYDRILLTSYQEAKEKVLQMKTELENERSEMVELEADLEAEQESLQTMLDEKRKTVENFNVQLAEAKAEANAYASKIKAQSEQIKKLEAEEARKRAEEAKKKAEAEKKARSENGNASSSQRPSSSEKSQTSTGDTINNSAGSAKGKEIANFACQFIGNPYVAGGTSLTNGADCSGFTQAVFRNFGISIPRNSSAQSVGGTGVAYSEAQPGDIICYAGHVGLYIGGGQIVHASTQRTGIKITNASYRTIMSVRRYY